MSKKSFILTSAGLKNVVIDEKYCNNFRFHFGDETLTTNKFLADFLCPSVSQLHQIDPTIEDIYYQYHNDFTKSTTSYTIFQNTITNIPEITKIFTKNTISHLSSLLKGEIITISKEESLNLQIVSIILDNDELFNKMNELYPIKKEYDEYNEEILEHYIKILDIISKFGNKKTFKVTDQIIDDISHHFHLLDKEHLKTLPLEIIYKIISSQSLQLESEDSLFEFINELFESNDEKLQNEQNLVNNINKTVFYENIEISQLSEEKFNELIELIEFNKMSSILWSKLKTFFYTFIKKVSFNEKRYRSKLIEYDGNTNNSFKGIIFQLTEKYGGNVDDKGIVKITPSSIHQNYLAKYAADFNDNPYFHSEREKYSWLKYDFKERKICPTHYSMRTSSCTVNSSPSSWVLEASNSGKEEDWIVLDEQPNKKIFLANGTASHTFKITLQQNRNYYQFLRIRTTDKNNHGDNYFAIASIEFFGFVINNSN